MNKHIEEIHERRKRELKKCEKKELHLNKLHKEKENHIKQMSNVKIGEIPIEAIHDIDQQREFEKVYLLEKDSKIYKEYLKLDSNLRKVFTILDEMFAKDPFRIISYKEISERVLIKESTAYSLVHKLATWSGCPLIIINTPKKKGYFQLSSKNWWETETLLIQRRRYGATYFQRTERTTIAHNIQRSAQEREKIKIKKEQKKREKENRK